MTRSVEIPEAAISAFSDAYLLEVLSRVSTASLPSNSAVRAGLLAALPYLAPAGDGGLREALEELLKRRAVKGKGTVANSQLRELLAAHPAAPAVPQPAGEGATKLDCGICYRDDSDPEKIVFTYLAECGNHGRY